MAILAILQPDARASARLTEALAEAHTLVPCESWEVLQNRLSANGIQGCLIDAGQLHDDVAAERMGELKQQENDFTIIVGAESQETHGFFDLGGLGAHGVVSSALPRGRLRAEVDQAFSTARADEIARHLRRHHDAPGPEAVAWAIVHATHQTDVDRMASALGYSRRGLRIALHECGLPGPARTLLWGRLLVAGARLAIDGRAVEEVAFSLGYATSTSLARAMKKHTGFTLGQVAEGGGMKLVQDELFRGRRTRGSIASKLAMLALAASASSCATLGVGGPSVDRRAIRDVLESPGIAQMHVGILAVDATTGRTLFRHNAERKFVPASNQKILVTAAAMSMLGPDYRFRTEMWATGSRDGHFLDGDLVLFGSGDPSLSGRYWDSGTAALAALADSLHEGGLRTVAGSVFVDVSAWDSATVGPTWEVEDLRYAYGSTGGAFAIDEGEIEVVVVAGPKVGAPAQVSWSPLGTDDFVRSHVTTSPADSSTGVTSHYLPETRRLVLEGVVEHGTTDTLSFALRDPVRQASAVMANAIQAAGIELESGWEVRWTENERLGRDCWSGGLEACGGAVPLAALESPPLSELVAAILEDSQNWMTEQLIRSLAAIYGEEGSWSEGVDLVEAFLTEHVGVDTLDVSVRDGSGLSAYNLVTPRALVRILDHMGEGPFAAEYRAAMAEPGEQGSLEERLLDLEGRVYAKTGTISNVNSLSGYLVREDGHEVIFSILTNGSGLPSSYVRNAIDDIVRALAR